VTLKNDQRMESHREFPIAFSNSPLVAAVVVPVLPVMAPSMVLTVTKPAKGCCLFDSTRFAKAQPTRSDQAGRDRSRFSF
jgi:hypothetical protein